MGAKKVSSRKSELPEGGLNRSPRRVFLVSYLYDPHVRGGMGGFQKILDLAAELGRRHQVTLFLPGLSRHETALDCVWIPVLNVPLLRIFSFNLLLIPLMILKSLRKHPDIVYVRIFNALTPPLLARLLGAELITEFNGNPLQYYRARKSFKAWWVFRLVRWNLRRSRRIVALTEGLRRDIESDFGVDSSRVFVAPSGTDPELFHPRDRRECRRQLDLPEEEPMAVFAGTFFAYQGIDLLLTALDDPRFRELNVWLIGEGVKRQEWEARSRSLGLERVRFTGQMERARLAVYLGASNFCLAPFAPDRGEVSPLKVMDYLFCARATVVSRIPSVENLLLEFPSLVPFEAGDLSALRGALARVCGSPEHFDELALEDSRTARRRYAWEEIVRSIEASCF